MLILFAIVSHADETSTQEETSAPQVEIESFREPLLQKRIRPVYPRDRLIAGEESWVELNFMVDTEGKPYEIVVTDSIGHSSFKNAAIRAVKQWKYRPASYNGKSIDASARYKVIFQIENQPRAASDRFVRLQNALRKAVAEDNKEKADQYLNRLENDRRLTLYEDAFFNFAKYEYMSKWGTEDQQLNALDRAIANESGDDLLPTEMFVYALGKQLPLLLKKRDYQRAYRTYLNLSRQELDEEAKSWLEGIAAALNELRENQVAFELAGKIPETSSWIIELFKDEFWLEDISGHIVELKLRCFGEIKIIRYEPGIKYKFESKYGRCTLEILGDKGTTFRFFQS